MNHNFLNGHPSSVSNGHNSASSSAQPYSVDDLLSSDFCPQVTEQPLPRPVIIDACNVARSHSGRKHHKVSCQGILVVVRYFVSRGHKTISYMPITYKNRRVDDVREDIVVDREVLELLEQEHVLSFTPARKEHSVKNYDDLSMLQYAAERGGVVISNDAFSDILVNKEYRQFHHVIQNRRLTVKWNRSRRNGVRNERISSAEPMFNHNYVEYGINPNNLKCLPSEPDYNLVAHNQLDSNTKEHLLERIDQLFDRLSRPSSPGSSTVEEYSMRPSEDEGPSSEYMWSVQQPIEDILNDFLSPPLD